MINKYSNSGRDIAAGDTWHFFIRGFWQSSGDRSTCICSLSIMKCCMGT